MTRSTNQSTAADTKLAGCLDAVKLIPKDWPWIRTEIGFERTGEHKTLYNGETIRWARCKRGLVKRESLTTFLDMRRNFVYMAVQPLACAPDKTRHVLELRFELKGDQV